MSNSAIPLVQKIRREWLKFTGRLASKSTTVSSGDKRFTIPLLYGLGAEHVTLRIEPYFKHLLALLRDRQGAFVDIGANVGAYLLRLRLSGDSRPYYGFEPNPACNLYLQELIRRNQFKASYAFPLPLSDKTEQRRFFSKKLGDKISSLQRYASDDTDKDFSIDVMTLQADQIFSTLNLEAVAFIKIDVEGAELEVLRGLQQTIEKYQPLIYCEIWSLPESTDATYVERSQRIQSLLSLMRSCRYQVIAVEADRPRQIDCLADLSTHNDDYFFVPQNHIVEFLEITRQNYLAPKHQ